jgi:hypothetical protein
MAIDRRPSGFREIVTRVFLALAALCALAGPARSIGEDVLLATAVDG